MATTMAPEDAKYIRLPWETMAVECPGDFTSVGEMGCLRSVFATEVPGHAERIVLGFFDNSICKLRVTDFGNLLEAASKGGRVDTIHISVADSEMQRAATLCARLFVGACLELQEGTPIRPSSPSGSHGKTKRGSEEPTSWTYTLRRECKVDARQHVATYASGRLRGPVAVQTFVRGHWKRQAHGPNHSLRKWIHIEPFWRGPEDAPIVVRPHAIDDTSATGCK
jgi:hypothetical protein